MLIVRNISGFSRHILKSNLEMVDWLRNELSEGA